MRKISVSRLRPLLSPSPPPVALSLRPSALEPQSWIRPRPKHTSKRITWT